MGHVLQLSQRPSTLTVGPIESTSFSPSCYLRCCQLLDWCILLFQGNASQIDFEAQRLKDLVREEGNSGGLLVCLQLFSLPPNIHHEYFWNFQELFWWAVVLSACHPQPMFDCPWNASATQNTVYNLKLDHQKPDEAFWVCWFPISQASWKTWCCTFCQLLQDHRRALMWSKRCMRHGLRCSQHSAACHTESQGLQAGTPSSVSTFSSGSPGDWYSLGNYWQHFIHGNYWGSMPTQVESSYCFDVLVVKQLVASLS